MALVNLPFILTVLLTFVLGTIFNGILYGNSFRLLMMPEKKKKDSFIITVLKFKREVKNNQRF